MTNPELIAFVWSEIANGVIGNAIYDAIKLTLGYGFNRLSSYVKENKKSDFENALLSILETNEKIRLQLSLIQENPNNIQQQNHSGIGDNIGRDKTVNYMYSSPSQMREYNLTDKQKGSLKSLVEIGLAWREEFTITWDSNGDSDILEYDGNPPQIPNGHIRVLKEEGLINCIFNILDRAEITLTQKSYDAVEAISLSLDLNQKVSVKLIPYQHNDHASLHIKNDEMVSLTECYAILKELGHSNYIDNDLLIEINPSGIPLSWSGGKATNEGKRDVPGDSKIVAINIAVVVDNGLKPAKLKFLFHDHYPEIEDQGCFDVVVQFHGKINGKEFLPILFDGSLEFSSVFDSEIETLVTSPPILEEKKCKN